MNRKKIVAALLGLFMFVAVPLATAPSAQAWGEHTYPGTGWPIDSTHYRDAVHCLGSKNQYWMEVWVDSVYYINSSGQKRIDPYNIEIARFWHNSLGDHQFYLWSIADPQKLHIQQRNGPLPQTLINEWNPGTFDLEPHGNTRAQFNSNDGLNWTDTAISTNPQLYISMIGYYWTGYPMYRDGEVYTCTVDLGPAVWS